MGPVSPLDLRLRPPDRPPALTTGGWRKNMSRESSKSMKIGLNFEWEIGPRERFAQNPPKFVSIRRAGLTFSKHCQAGAPNGHVEPCAPGVMAPSTVADATWRFISLQPLIRTAKFRRRAAAGRREALAQVKFFFRACLPCSHAAV